MKRRALVNRLLLGATGVATATACQPLASQPTQEPQSYANPSVRWRMATSWPKSLDIVFGTVERICQRVQDITEGRFVITPYASGEVVPGLEVLDAVSDGTVECGHTASYYYVKKNPALAFGTTVPFGLNAQQHMSWLLYGGGLEVLHNLYADFNVINFPSGSTGAQMGGWFLQEVQSVADLQGLTMRIPGLGGEVLTRLGAQVKVLAGSEIFAALESGEVQAAEWVGPYEDERLGLNRIAPFYYYPGWWEPGTTYEVHIHRPAWDSLPAEYQEVLHTAIAESNLHLLAQYDAMNGEALRRLQLTGTQLKAFSPEILEAAHQTTFEIYNEMAAADPAFKAIFEQWNTFRTQVYQWNRVNELSFANFALMVE
jgi:TRAP-type mannitol/chloroaromatic compound transport system substrate-binding protein